MCCEKEEVIIINYFFIYFIKNYCYYLLVKN